MDRFSFLLIDEQNRLVGLRNYTLQVDKLNLKEHLQDIYINDDLLKLPYRKIFLAIENKRHTLIPKRLFRQEDGAVYLEKLFGEITQQEVFADEVAGIDALSIYQIPKDVDQLLKGYFSVGKQVHLGTAILAGVRNLAEQHPGKNIYVYVLDKRLYISYFDDRELIFFNAYDYRTAKDFIYYLLLVFDQFQIKPESVPVHLGGYIVEDSEIYHLLYRYIRILQWINAPAHFQFGQKFSSLPKHLYFALYSLRLCE